jgi:hypothetical protein
LAVFPPFADNPKLVKFDLKLVKFDPKLVKFNPNQVRFDLKEFAFNLAMNVIGPVKVVSGQPPNERKGAPD